MEECVSADEKRAIFQGMKDGFTASDFAEFVWVFRLDKCIRRYTNKQTNKQTNEI